MTDVTSFNVEWQGLHDKIPPMEFNHCPSCDWPYLPGEASYCTKCGTLLSKSINPAQEIKQLESQSKPYEALRFTSWLIVVLGWAVIIFGWLFAITFGSVVAAPIAKNIVAKDAAENVIQNFDLLVIVIIGMITTIYGILLIASGQVISALLDIRDDTHTTMRLIRRFGLLMSEK